MSGPEFRDSLRAAHPRVFVNGRLVDSIADDRALAPGINAVAVTYDSAHEEHNRDLLTAT